MKIVLKVMVTVSFMFYSVALIVLLFLSYRGYISDGMSLIDYIKGSSNIVPFKTIMIYVGALFDGSMNMDIPIKNLFGNAFMFLPMGIYLPYLIKRMEKLIVFSFSMITLLFFIEVIQLMSRRGSFDVDELIGFSIYKLNFLQKLLNRTSVQV